MSDIAGLTDEGLDRFAAILENDVFHGKLPPFPAEIVTAVVMALPRLREFPAEDVERWSALLYRALVRRLAAQWHLDTSAPPVSVN